MSVFMLESKKDVTHSLKNANVSYEEFMIAELLTCSPLGTSDTGAYNNLYYLFYGSEIAYRLWKDKENSADDIIRKVLLSRKIPSDALKAITRYYYQLGESIINAILLERRLTQQARKKLPLKDFAGPNRTYPINDKKHVVAAIAYAKKYWNAGGTPQKKAREAWSSIVKAAAKFKIQIKNVTESSDHAVMDERFLSNFIDSVKNRIKAFAKKVKDNKRYKLLRIKDKDLEVIALLVLTIKHTDDKITKQTLQRIINNIENKYKHIDTKA